MLISSSFCAVLHFSSSFQSLVSCAVFLVVMWVQLVYSDRVS